MATISIQRILIVGLGSIGLRHLRLARQLQSNADICVLRHRPTDEVPEFANGVFSSLAEAIAFQPQLAVIASPAPMHAEAAIALAQAGAHLLIEKPVAANVADARRILETCQASARVCHIAYNLRFLPGLQRFRELLGEGVIGQAISVRCEIGQYLPSWRPEKDYRDTVSAQRALGGGVLLELSHELDYLRWLFGDYAWVKAYLGRQSALEIDVEDTAHILIGFAEDKTGRQLVANLSMDFVRHDTTRVCTAIGEAGSLRLNAIAGTVEICRPGETWSELHSHKAQRDETYIAEWQALLQGIDTQASVAASPEDGLQVLKVIEAIHLAAQSDTTIKLG